MLFLNHTQVLVLPSITARASKDMAAIDPHSSNVYSTPERVLLAWLNQHYVAHRSTIFGGKGWLHSSLPTSPLLPPFSHLLHLPLSTLLPLPPFFLVTHNCCFLSFIYLLILAHTEAIDRVATTFDVDLMDCTFLACAMAAYCPFLVRTLNWLHDTLLPSLSHTNATGG